MVGWNPVGTAGVSSASSIGCSSNCICGAFCDSVGPIVPVATGALHEPREGPLGCRAILELPAAGGGGGGPPDDLPPGPIVSGNVGGLSQEDGPGRGAFSKADEELVNGSGIGEYGIGVGGVGVGAGVGGCGGLGGGAKIDMSNESLSIESSSIGMIVRSRSLIEMSGVSRFRSFAKSSVSLKW